MYKNTSFNIFKLMIEGLLFRNEKYESIPYLNGLEFESDIIFQLPKPLTIRDFVSIF